MINRISSVTPVNFSAKKRVSFGGTAFEGVNKEPESFYGLSDSNKLNVIFDMLVNVRANQENAYSTITKNQYNMQNANQRAFRAIHNIPRLLIDDIYDCKTISHIPSKPVFSEAKNSNLKR